MAQDDLPASSTAAAMRGKVGSEFEGLAMASIARDDPPLFLAMIPSLAPACTATAMWSKLGRNLKPKLAIMCQCTSVTDRQTDGH